VIRAVIFDFNGVITDDEALHYQAFAEALGRQGRELTRAAYDEHCLGRPDLDCALAVGSEDAEEAARLVRGKAQIYARFMEDGIPLFPGAAALVRALAARVPLAINSGAPRGEIEVVLAHAGLREAFTEVVTADDHPLGKPHPEGYLLALAGLRARHPDLQARDCLVIEDAPAGVHAARDAGMRCLAVTHSHPAADLSEAGRVVGAIAEIDVDELLSFPPWAGRMD
jgi:beta-phosphoglucomutase